MVPANLAADQITSPMPFLRVQHTSLNVPNSFRNFRLVSCRRGAWPAALSPPVQRGAVASTVTNALATCTLPAWPHVGNAQSLSALPTYFLRHPFQNCSVPVPPSADPDFIFSASTLYCFTPLPLLLFIPMCTVTYALHTSGTRKVEGSPLSLCRASSLTVLNTLNNL